MNLFKEVFEVCKALNKEKNWKRFSPQHLVYMEGVGSLDEIDQVCGAFSYWTALGYFKLEAEVIDEKGKTICGGSVTDWKEPSLLEAETVIKNEDECFISISYAATEKFLEQCIILK